MKVTTCRCKPTKKLRINYKDTEEWKDSTHLTRTTPMTAGFFFNYSGLLLKELQSASSV